MICLSKRFSLTNDNSTMEEEFMSKNGYLAEKEDTEDMPKGSISKTLQCDIEIKEFLKMLAFPEIKHIYHQR